MVFLKGNVQIMEIKDFFSEITTIVHKQSQLTAAVASLSLALLKKLFKLLSIIPTVLGSYTPNSLLLYPPLPRSAKIHLAVAPCKISNNLSLVRFSFDIRATSENDIF